MECQHVNVGQPNCILDLAMYVTNDLFCFFYKLYKLRPGYLPIQSNLVNTTLVYTTHFLARPNFSIQNSLLYMTTTLNNVTFKIYVLSYERES